MGIKPTKGISRSNDKECFITAVEGGDPTALHALHRALRFEVSAIFGEDEDGWAASPVGQFTKGWEMVDAFTKEELRALLLRQEPLTPLQEAKAAIADAKLDLNRAILRQEEREAFKALEKAFKALDDLAAS